MCVLLTALALLLLLQDSDHVLYLSTTETVANVHTLPTPTAGTLTTPFSIVFAQNVFRTISVWTQITFEDAKEKLEFLVKTLLCIRGHKETCVGCRGGGISSFYCYWFRSSTVTVFVSHREIWWALRSRPDSECYLHGWWRLSRLHTVHRPSAPKVRVHVLMSGLLHHRHLCCVLKLWLK